MDLKKKIVIMRGWCLAQPMFLCSRSEHDSRSVFIVRGANRRIFVYTFCLINICLSLSDDANKIKTQNIERA